MSIAVKQKKRGRPATGRDPFVGIRLPVPLIEQVEAWGKKNEAASRSDAIRRLLETALAIAQRTTPSANNRTAAKASEMAGSTIDRLGDKSAPPNERAKRKRRLVKGPSEFRDLRDDLPKRKR